MRSTALILTALVAGCGSGAARSTPPAHYQTASVLFKIVPTKPPASSARRPKYVSYGTQSARIVVSAPGVPPITSIINFCSLGSCSGTVDAPVATDTFTVTLYDDYGGQGNVLSAGSTTQTIVQNQANSVNVTFDGVPVHTSGLNLDAPNPLIGGPSTTNVHVNAIDAQGYTIVGPGNYNPPVQLTLNDPSGSTSLSKTTITSPNDVVTLSYNGTPKIAATLTSAVQGGKADSTAVFEPANVSKEFGIANPEAQPIDIVKGPDGAMWFAQSSVFMVGRIDGAGNVTEYGTTSSPSNVILGPDGALWFTELGALKQYGRIDTGGGRSGGGVTITEYTIQVPVGSSPNAAALAFGADGNLYVADGGSAPAIYVVTPATGALVKTYPLAAAPNAIVSGPDGNIWFGTAGSIARIRLADGTVSTFPTSGEVMSVAAGTDGNVWFTDHAGKIGKVATDGSVTEYAVPNYGRAIYKIIAAADGTYWFTQGRGTDGDGSTCRLGHATAAGSITSYAIADCTTPGLAFGPDQNIWLAEATRKKIGIFSSF